MWKGKSQKERVEEEKEGIEKETGSRESQEGKMQEVGFEPTPPKRILPESTALDHSATLASNR